MVSPTPPDEDVRSALLEILAWPEIARSPQLARFLSYIVDAKLRGQEEAIKAYAIAVDVFGRPSSFDPQTDPIVRVQARRLRALLEQYYAEGLGRRHDVHIRLPVGRYVPEFDWASDSDRLLKPAVILPMTMTPISAAEPSEFVSSAAVPPKPVQPVRPNGVLLVTLFCLLVLGGAMVLWVEWFPPVHAVQASEVPAPPAVTIYEFQDLTGSGVARPMIAGLALELVTDLRLFDDIVVSYSKRIQPSAEEREAAPAGTLFLTGVVRRSHGALEYVANLSDFAGEAPFWSYSVTLPDADAVPDIDDISRSFAMMLGSHRGPMHQSARAWTEQATNLAGAASPYLCLVLFELYRDTAIVRDANDTQVCLDALDSEEKQSGVAMASQAALSADMAMRDPTMLTSRPKALLAADELVTKAIEVDPTSSFVWEQAARIRELRGATTEARSAYISALQLNPANTDAMASYGRMLSMTADWKAGEPLARSALVGSPNPPTWYYVGPALNTLRGRDTNLALSYAESMAQTDPELGPLVAVTAAMEAGNIDVVNRYMPVVLGNAAFKAKGVVPRLKERLSDVALVTRIGNALKRAGVPAAVLESPF